VEASWRALLDLYEYELMRTSLPARRAVGA